MFKSKDKNFKGKTYEEYSEFRKKRNEANRKYYSKPEVKEKRKRYKKEYEKKNLKRIRAREKAYRQKPEVKERIKKWREDNREHVKKYRSSEEYKKKKRKSDKRWREKNKEKLKRKRMNPTYRAWRKKLYEKNREHLKEVRKKYYKTKAGILSYKRANHIKLALRKERPTDLTREKIDKIFRRDKVCVYCGSSEKLELDHIVSLKNGGTSLYINFVLACAKCNRSKHQRDVFKWCNLQGIEVPKIVLELLEKQRIKALA